MQPQLISRKILIFVLTFTLLLCSIYAMLFRNNNQTKIVFCSVGQGDGSYIRIDGKYDVLIDLGPDKSILKCLNKYLPFYDRHLDLVMVSHPEKDHYGGLQDIMTRYSITTFIAPSVGNPGTSYNELITSLRKKGTRIYFPVEGDVMKVGNATFEIYWPSKLFISRNVSEPKPGEILGSTSENLNDFSIIFSLTEHGKRILYTGDASPSVLQKVDIDQTYPYDVLKVPHHGALTGLTYSFLNRVNPRLSVISVGKKNKFGHPHTEIADMLSRLRKTYRRTDLQGDIIYSIPLPEKH